MRDNRQQYVGNVMAVVVASTPENISHTLSVSLLLNNYCQQFTQNFS